MFLNNDTVMRKLVLIALLFYGVSSLQYQELDSEDACGGSLILTSLIRSGNASQARTLSEVSSDPFLGLKSHAGFLTVMEQYASNLFFWFFPAKTQLKTTPWIIWLQGGPGISSLVGLFELIGPLRVEHGEVTLRNITWTSDYSVVFLDNPVGAGFSFTNDDKGYLDNEDDVGAQMLEFLRQFLEMFPELREAPLFLAGESYAGKYVPALGIHIHRYKSEKHPINLRGLMISSGLIEPRSMMNYSQLMAALGFLTVDEVDAVRNLEQSVVRLIDEGRMVSASNKFNETIEYIKKHSDVDIYNFGKDPKPINKAYDFEEFVNRPAVRKAIGVGNVTFHYNNQKVYQKMLPDITNTTKPFLEELLKYYGVLCYHGQQDIIVPYSLTIDIYKSLNWPGRQEYVDAPRKRLRSVSGDVVAFKKSGGNFTEVLVRHAGHMVPGDQPEVTKFIVDQFIIKHK